MRALVRSEDRPDRFCGPRGGSALLAVAVAAMAAVAGCTSGERGEAAAPRLPRDVEVPFYLKDTIGEMARFAGEELIPVQGYGFVTGLDDTGTTVVPPGVRREILFMMKQRGVEDAEEWLARKDTAVVTVAGQIPAGAGAGEAFDLQVQAIGNTETTSLEGGFLLECELRRRVLGRAGEMRSEPLATGRGPIFVSPFRGEGATPTDPRGGRVLGGGQALKARSFRLVLMDPSIRVAEQMVRLINARFKGAAKGTRDVGIDLVVPALYQEDKSHFLDVIGSIYLRELPDARDRRVRALIEAMGQQENPDMVGVALEAFGAGIVPQIRPLGTSRSEDVRFYAGRTLARLQDPQALHILEKIALNPDSEFQEEAVRALGWLPEGMGIGVAGRALDTPNARVRVAAWQVMNRIIPGSTVVAQFPDKFKLSHVASRAEPFVYVSRTLEPHLVIFGDVRMVPPVFAEAGKGVVTAQANDREATVIARHGGRNYMMKVPLGLEAMIRVAGGPLSKGDSTDLTGLDLDYSDLVG